MPFPACIKNVDTTRLEDITALEIKCHQQCGYNRRFISVRNHYKSPVLYSPTIELSLGFIDPNKRAVLANIERDSPLYHILKCLQEKCIAGSPDPAKTMPFMKESDKYDPQVRLHTQFTMWKNDDGKSIDLNTALPTDPRAVTLKMWTIEFYRLHKSGGKYHIQLALSKCRVTKVERETDTTQQYTSIDDIPF